MFERRDYTSPRSVGPRSVVDHERRNHRNSIAGSPKNFPGDPRANTTTLSRRFPRILTPPITSLAPGTRLGPYEALAPLGAGGMGEVYRATDTKLGRDVAIKILPEVFAQDADRLARFEREAKTLASLNHPNIAAIFGIEESGGARTSGRLVRCCSRR